MSNDMVGSQRRSHDPAMTPAPAPVKLSVSWHQPLIVLPVNASLQLTAASKPA
jgi:hypothetical protein